MAEKKQRRQLIVTGVLILLAALGILINETDYMGSSHTKALQYLEVYSAFFLGRCCGMNSIECFLIHG